MTKTQPFLAIFLEKLVQLDQLNKCFEITSKIVTKSPTAVKTAIKVINAGYNNKQNGYEAEIEEFGKSFGSADFKEGVNAFLEKRKANFLGNQYIINPS